MPIFRRHDEAPRERTPEERERARAERAARRAARQRAPTPAAFEHLAPEEPDPQPPDPRDFDEQPPDVPPSQPAEPPEPDLPPEDPDVEVPDRIDFDEEPHDFPPRPAEPPAPALPPEAPDVEVPDRRDFDEEPHDFPPAAAAGDAAHDLAAASGSVDAGDVAAGSDAPPADPSALQPTAPFDPLADDAPPRPAPRRAPIVPPASRRVQGDRERPVAPRRVSARERRLPPTPPPPGTPAFSKRRRRRGRILATLLLLVFLALAFAVNALFQPFKGDGGEEVTVRIPPGSTVADVGDVLAENEVVDSSLLFTIRARIAGAEPKAGTYRLKRDSSYGDALDALEADPAAPRTIKVVIPEGRSRTETAPIVREAGLKGSYLDASDRQAGFQPAKYGAPRRTKTLEGFLFPATYELAPGAPSSRLVQLQLEAFRSNIRQVDMKRARRRNLTVYDVLIIASMVEREATLAKERPIIAAVIHNRLRQGMPLGIDATIRYATRNWSEPLKESELAIDSPYNTRRRTGLPPTPIGSPGLDSIRAAANPANVDYLFYVVKPGGDGAHNFSSTDEEFQRDVDAYNRERERRGGKSPASSG